MLTQSDTGTTKHKFTLKFMKKTTRTYTQKDNSVWEWEETKEVQKALQELHSFSGNYPGPLYAPHPNIKDEKN